MPLICMMQHTTVHCPLWLMFVQNLLTLFSCTRLKPLVRLKLQLNFWRMIQVTRYSISLMGQVFFRNNSLYATDYTLNPLYGTVSDCGGQWWHIRDCEFSQWHIRKLTMLCLFGFKKLNQLYAINSLATSSICLGWCHLFLKRYALNMFCCTFLYTISSKL
jgi:hypothetical protein